MTSLYYGLDVPYEVQLEHTSASATHMTILESQRSPGRSSARHLLAPGVYMVSLSYNGAQAATLRHDGGGTTNTVAVPPGTAGTPRTSTPIKISVQGTTEELLVAAPAATGGTARATISVIPAATFDEMAESTQGVSVLSEISNLKTTKADKSTLDARIPANISLRLDTTVGTRIMAGDMMLSGEIPRRDITGAFSGALTGGTISVIRIDNLMYFSFAYANIADNAEITMSLPAGWRPIATTTEKLHAANGDEVGEIYINWAGAMTFKKFSGPSINDTAIFACDTWPTTLIGTPS